MSGDRFTRRTARRRVPGDNRRPQTCWNVAGVIVKFTFGVLDAYGTRSGAANQVGEGRERGRADTRLGNRLEDLAGDAEHGADGIEGHAHPLSRSMISAVSRSWSAASATAAYRRS